MVDKNEFRKEFFAQETLELNQIIPNEAYTHYKMKDSGQVLFETVVDSGLGGEDVEIAFMTDMHINTFNKEDEEDWELMLTKQHRWWNKNGSSIGALDGALKAAQFADISIIGGDTLDFLSRGNMDVVKEHIFDRYPEILMVLGSHELSKHVETGQPDTLSIEDRRNILRNFWIHNMHFEARDVKDKVICVGLDNSMSYYYDGNAALLQEQVDRARKENKIILLFQHEPLSTGVEKDANCRALYSAYMSVANFYDKSLIYAKNRPLKHDDAAMYEVLKNSTDVIKGIFCGHMHSLFYNEIEFDNGKKLPQYTCVGNTYFGYEGVVTRIIVK